MGKPGKVHSKGNSRSPCTFEICQAIRPREYLKKDVLEHFRAHLELLFLRVRMQCSGDTQQKLHNRAARIITSSSFDSSAAHVAQIRMTLMG